ncbi:hypothetical protein [Blautia producta]|uniref:hypothetical protein n=1 Tax=Blautia producta TaxID=33035 RepID=UPI0035615649
MKHIINKEDIRFLKSLQHEMNAQDTVYPTDARFWAIAGSKKTYGVRSGYEDGFELYDQDSSETVADGFEDSIKYIVNEVFFPVTNKKALEKDDEYLYFRKEAFEEDDEYFRLEMVITMVTLEKFAMSGELLDTVYFDNIYEFIDWVNKEAETSLTVCNYACDEDAIYPDTFFITHKQAKWHLERQKQNYCADAHTYEMAALLSPEVEQLWKFLQEADFDAMESAVSDRFYLIDRYHDDNLTNQTTFDVQEVVEFLKLLKTSEENHVDKMRYIPQRIDHGLLHASTIDAANWQLWANHYGFDVRISEETVNYWYVERWSDGDITATLEDLGIETSLENIQRACSSVTGIFADKTDRNEMLKEVLEKEFGTSGDCHG